jgi:sugar phosphate isomerase/epimerase
VKLAVQEQLLPGRSLQEKFAFAVDAGFDAIELRGKGDFHFAERLPELRQALADGVTMPTVCVDMSHFIGDFDAAKREDAVQQLRSQLTVIGELGGAGVMTPACWGQFSLIEEDDPCRSLMEAAPYLAHMQISESNRNQPGTGHLDWAAQLATLDAIGYDGYLALECRLRGEPEIALPQTAAFIRKFL